MAAQTVNVTFVGGNADRRELALTPPDDGVLPHEQLFLGSTYLFDAHTQTYRYCPLAELNPDENRFGPAQGVPSRTVAQLTR